MSVSQIDDGHRFWLSTLGTWNSWWESFLWLILEEVRQSKTTVHCSEEGRKPDEWRFILGVSFSLFHMPSDRCYQGLTTHAMKRRRTSILSVSGPIIRKATSVGPAKSCSIGQVTRVMTDCMCGRYCS
jgi:hypothetical protein